MNWGEVYKINEHARGREFNNSYIFEGTSTQNWNVPFNGYYKIIVVGAGGTGASKGIFSGSSMVDKETAGGGAGGVAIKTILLNSSTTFQYIPTTTQIEFKTSSTATPVDMIATNGGNGTATGSKLTGGAGGTATGGDFNYAGCTGTLLEGQGNGSVVGASLGCFIQGLSSRVEETRLDDDSSGDRYYALKVTSGYGILGHGAGDGWSKIKGSTALSPIAVQNEKQTGCVIVIPLEKV